MPFLEKLKEEFPDLKTIFEVGAHRGIDIPEIHKLWPEATIYAFEADPINYEICKSKFLDNPKVKVLNIAVSNKSGKMTFNRYFDISEISDEETFSGDNYPKTGMGSLKKPGDGMINIFRVPKTHEEITVDAVSLFDFCNENNIAYIDALLMDVQGGEFDVFCGCQDLLDTVKATIFEWSTNRIMYEGETDFNIIKSMLELSGMKEIDREYQFQGISGDSLFVRK